MENSNKFETKVINLESVVDNKFVIPTYQRPFVWKEEQISKLLNDCIGAYSESPDLPCFIGTVLTSRKKDHYELIDGQQRFTTLWLVSVVFHKLNIKSDLIKFLRCGNQLRLGFEIRKEVEQYFELLLLNPFDTLKKYSESDLEKSIYLKDISMAISTIEGILKSAKVDKNKNNPINLEKFGDYLFSKVKMINNITPTNIDLNKLFATVNNSGIQLEQTDILKSNLLEKITSDKLIYSKIWESCENMNDYFERNIRKIFTETNWIKLSEHSFSEFKDEIFKFKNVDIGDDIDGYSVRELINQSDNDNDNSTTNIDNEETYYEINIRSIVTFGQLLLHTYRIYLYNKGVDDFTGPFHTNRLIEIFEKLKKDSDVKYFFKLLWKVRYMFDKYVIKWVIDLNSKTEYLGLTSITKGTNGKYTYFGRNVLDKSDSLMLQSVMYFTGDYMRQYWLTPFLCQLIIGGFKDGRKSNDLRNRPKNYILPNT